jgi:hypothetical protein
MFPLQASPPRSKGSLTFLGHGLAEGDNHGMAEAARASNVPNTPACAGGGKECSRCMVPELKGRPACAIFSVAVIASGPNPGVDDPGPGCFQQLRPHSNLGLLGDPELNRDSATCKGRRPAS